MIDLVFTAGVFMKNNQRKNKSYHRITLFVFSLNKKK
jgi:hypothetical protein